MKLRDKILSYLGVVRASEARAAIKHMQARAFAAAANTKLTQDWSLFPTEMIDADLRYALPGLRNRIRELAKNDSITRNSIREFVRNVVGPFGFKLRLVIKENGERLKAVEDEIRMHFALWSRCATIDGKHSFRSLCKLIVRYLVRDGEAFIRKMTVKNNPYAFALQVIEPEMVDDQYTEDLGNGNLIIMGVEINAANQVIAYHIKKPSVSARLYGYASQVSERERVPAQEIYHIYDPDFYTQTRGFTWFAAPALQMKMRSGFAEASLVRARFAASIGGVIEQKEGDKGYQGDSEDSRGNTTTEIEPGMLKVLLPGQEMKSFDPNFPSPLHEPFMKINGREIGAGLGQDYATLFQDYSDSNYSSLRQALLPVRDNYMDIQETFIEQFCNRVFADWLNNALFAGAIAVGGKKLLTQNFDKYNKPVFYGRRWPWVDPEKDQNAKMNEIKSGFSSFTEVIAELGGDRDEVFEQLQKDWEAIKEKELPIDLNFSGKPSPAQIETDPATKVVKQAKELIKTNGHTA